MKYLALILFLLVFTSCIETVIFDGEISNDELEQIDFKNNQFYSTLSRNELIQILYEDKENYKFAVFPVLEEDHLLELAFIIYNQETDIRHRSFSVNAHELLEEVMNNSILSNENIIAADYLLRNNILDSAAKEKFKEVLNSSVQNVKPASEDSKCDELIIVELEVIETVDEMPVAVHLINVPTLLTCGNGGGEGDVYVEVEPIDLSQYSGLGGILTGNTNTSESSTSNGSQTNQSNNFSLDSIIVDVDASQYPCIASILDHFNGELLENVGGEIGSLVDNIFGTGGDFNLTFKVDGSLAQSVSGTTSTISSNSGVSINIDISINPSLELCSQDYLYSTILHEALHAYMNYQRSIMDPFEFRNEFPIADPPVVSSSGVNIEYYDHQLMAQQYVFHLEIASRAFNPELSAEHAEHLAWGGLSSTTAFNDLHPDKKNAILLTNNAASCNKHSGDTNTYNFKSCIN